MVFRVNKTNDYTVMSNANLRDKRLSLKAKGLITLMLSLPENWDYSIDGLCKITKDGYHSVMSGLQELEQFGYLARSRITGENGRVTDWRYDIYEKPQSENPQSDFPQSDFPQSDFPQLDKPQLENPRQLNTNTLNTKISSTKRVNTDIAAAVNKDIYTATAAADTIAIFETNAQNEKDRAYIAKWKSYGFAESVYKAAYDKMLRLINKVNFVYYDKIVTDWYSAGVKGIEIPTESFDVAEFIDAAMKRGAT